MPSSSPQLTERTTLGPQHEPGENYLDMHRQSGSWRLTEITMDALAASRLGLTEGAMALWAERQSRSST
jgi:hypothetical protein